MRGVPSASVAAPARKTLLEPGHEDEWAEINEADDREEAEFAAKLSISERLEFGQKLCDQAFSFYNAVHARDRGPRRDPRA